MIQAYNFLASWQLFPEKGTYEFGERPRSGIYKLEAVEHQRLLSITMNWVTLPNQAFESSYTVLPDGAQHTFENTEIALIRPKEWGGGAGPYKRFVAPVKLLADHTWMEMV